jgi:hypothetical protein
MLPAFTRHPPRATNSGKDAMPYLLNTLYVLALVVLSPWLLYKALMTGKYRRGSS